MTKKETSCGDMDKAVSYSDDVFSFLSAVINSGKFWRCNRWCHDGSTVLITSPVLFEKRILQRMKWKLQLKIATFYSFVDSLQEVGFQKVLNQRSSKVQKFRYPDFKKGCENFPAFDSHEERGKAKRKRKTSEEENAEFSDAMSATEENEAKDKGKKVKRQRMAP